MFARSLLVLAGLLGLGACKPQIGDKCILSTDCSTNNDRLCDTSQPGGYCTQIGCRGNSCPDEASCVLFGSSIPGCGFDDRSGPSGSRVSRAFCMAKCTSNSDCRGGYVCAEPTKFPWNAAVLDDDQSKKSCMPAPLEGLDASPPSASSPSVCSPVPVDAGSIDAAAPSIDAGAVSIPPLFPDAGPSDGG